MDYETRHAIAQDCYDTLVNRTTELYAEISHLKEGTDVYTIQSLKMAQYVHLIKYIVSQFPDLNYWN